MKRAAIVLVGAALVAAPVAHAQDPGDDDGPDLGNVAWGTPPPDMQQGDPSPAPEDPTPTPVATAVATATAIVTATPTATIEAVATATPTASPTPAVITPTPTPIAPVVTATVTPDATPLANPVVASSAPARRHRKRWWDRVPATPSPRLQPRAGVHRRVVDRSAVVAAPTRRATPAATRVDDRPAVRLAARAYVVRSGDSLSAIGARFGVSWEYLWHLNSATMPEPGNPNLIVIGETIRL